MCTAKWIYKDELFLINLLSLIVRTELQLENFLLKLKICAFGVHQTLINLEFCDFFFKYWKILTNICNTKKHVSHSDL